MTKAPLGSGREDKENTMVWTPLHVINRTKLKPSKHQAYVPSYKPKFPTPPKLKSIHSFFTPQSKPLEDITPIVQKLDKQKVNMAPSTPKIFSKPKSTMKRHFNMVNAEETITSKRARLYFGSDDDSDTAASPFFSRDKSASNEIEKPDTTPEKFHQPKGIEGLDIDGIGPESEETNKILETVEERQVSESPPRPNPTEVTSMDVNEVIPDSPPVAGPNKHQTQSGHDSGDVIHASWCDQPETQDTFLPSPPPSCPTQPISNPFTSNVKHTPILHPGIKKVYTPHPLHVILPDTPTPSPTLTPQHSQVVQGWKERFLNTSNQTPKFTNSISTSPMTPLHTPFLRRKPLTPIPSVSDVPVKKTRPLSLRLAAEQIEDTSPPRGKPVCLDQFRFTPK